MNEYIHPHYNRQGTYEGTKWIQYHKGLNLRDYIAIKAMNGCLSYSCDTHQGNWQSNSNPEDISEFCYQMADAMLKKRNTK
jgi:hypothetical protein